MTGNSIIKVWTLDVEAVPLALWAKVVAMLSPEERVRADRQVLVRARREIQVAHALKRWALTGDVAGIVSPSEWRFEVGRFGKPRVAGRNGPTFSLSHSEGLVACAVHSQIDLGLDIEKIDKNVPMEVVNDCFAPQEKAWLHGLPAVERAEAFIKVWTLKEAYVKATGRGLSESLKTFGFTFDPIRMAHVDFTSIYATWNFYQQLVAPTHMLALAWENLEINHVQIESIDPKFLFE